MMNTLVFSIDRAVSARHPHILVGGFRAGNLRRAAGLAAEGLDAAFATAGETLQSAGVTPQNLVDQPAIAAWREAISSCGLKASRYRGSAEQLARRVLKDGLVRTPLPLVSLYCAVSAQFLAPMGAYDVARLPEGEITLRLGDPGRDTFLPLGGDGNDMPITDRVVIYASDSKVICWAYNVRDSRETCFTADTDQGVFMGEAVEQSQHSCVRAGLTELRRQLGQLGASVGEVEFFDGTRPEGEIAAP